ncbi:hypothetical protein [Catenuloplanes atrovinosus]|uniref:Lipoprotein n=1 Tax=Catenuloplanes atrovinosus TaxID=137266 RepID=A0AAE3YNT1_9ACTN|nr:hypothetical protein [Catenuloplanes atrovinosus]MDR7275905.1 hypothetical protein [Catenuloplanes atrovinosus]
MSAGKRTLSVLLVAVAATPVLGACGATDNSELRQIKPGSAVYVDAWDETGDRGDQAQVERKPSGLWVVPLQAHFRQTKGKGFDVRVELTADGLWRVDPEGAQVGRDHDDCLEDGEAYAQLVVAESALRWEPDTGGGNDGDDCFTLQPES